MVSLIENPILFNCEPFWLFLSTRISHSDSSMHLDLLFGSKVRYIIENYENIFP